MYTVRSLFSFPRIIQPWLIGQLLKAFTSATTNQLTAQEAYLYATGVVLTTALPVLSNHHQVLMLRHISLQMKTAICSLIYSKVCCILFWNGLWNAETCLFVGVGGKVPVSQLQESLSRSRHRQGRQLDVERRQPIRQRAHILPLRLDRSPSSGRLHRHSLFHDRA